LKGLRADGATGELYGVDSCKKTCGTWDYDYSTIWIMRNGLVGFGRLSSFHTMRRRIPSLNFRGNADVFLLNDIISFWGQTTILLVLETIDRTSRVGTKIIGWMVSQEGDESVDFRRPKREVDFGKDYGDGLRGCMPTVEVFKTSFCMSNVYPEIKWNLAHSGQPVVHTSCRNPSRR
jgi:hypothetical protein